MVIKWLDGVWLGIKVKINSDLCIYFQSIISVYIKTILRIVITKEGKQQVQVRWKH